MCGRWDDMRADLREMRQKIVAFIALLIGAALLLSHLTSCAGPDERTRIDRATYDAIAPRYTRYLHADAELSAEQRARYLRTVETWDAYIKTNER